MIQFLSRANFLYIYSEARLIGSMKKLCKFKKISLKNPRLSAGLTWRLLWRKESCCRSCRCWWLRLRAERLDCCWPTLLFSPLSPSIFMFVMIFSVADGAARCWLAADWSPHNKHLFTFPGWGGRETPLSTETDGTRAGQTFQLQGWLQVSVT